MLVYSIYCIVVSLLVFSPSTSGSFGLFFIVSGVPTFVQPILKIQMFDGQTFMFESILNLFSRYVSTVGSKRRYHSSRVCAVDIAARDSCRFCTIPYYRKLTLHEIKVLEINANLMENDFRIKKINAKEEVEFQNRGN